MLLKESERRLKGKVVDEEKEQNSEAEMPEFQTVLSIPWRHKTLANLSKLCLAPSFSPTFLSLIFMALGIQFTRKSTERAARLIGVG